MSPESNTYKARFLQSNILLSCVVLLLILKIGATVISFNFPQNLFFADITKSALQIFVNQARQANGLQPLTENIKLNEAAQFKAENMVQNQYFDHTSPTGVTPWFWFSKAGYTYKYAGENLAIGFFDSKEVYDAWLNSPSHKANILNPHYTEVGTAVLNGFGDNNTIVVVQEFGSPQPAKQIATAKAKPTAKVTEAIPAAGTQTTSAPQTSIVSETKNVRGDASSKVANTALNNYGNMLQEITYGFSFVLIGILLTMIFFNANFEKKLVFRSILIIVLLFTASLINRSVIISLIPHQILI